MSIKLEENNRDNLKRQLIDARYKILVSIRPVAPARNAFNLTLSALIAACSCEDMATVEMLRSLMFEITIGESRYDDKV